MITLADSKDGKGRTLWQILTGQNKKEVVVVNPLGVKPGDFLNLFGQNENYIVTKIVQTVFRFENISEFINCVDYELSLDGKQYVLRYENQGSTYKLLRIYDEFPYAEEFEEIFVEDDNFHILEDKDGNPCEDVYFSDSRLIFKSNIGGDQVSYRDYLRSVNETGETEFLTIERNDRTKMFRILLGINVTSGNIMVFKGAK